MSTKKEKEVLLNLLKSKSGLKQDVFENTQKWFAVFKQEIENCVEKLAGKVKDERIRFRFEDKGSSEAQLFLGSDVLVFHMHTNVFKLPPNDYTAQTSYVKSNPAAAYCGVINVYNFLADSYQFNRINDAGYLICRILINAQDHYKIEGKGDLGVIYQNFMDQKISAEQIHDIILQIGILALDFDLYTPPYETVNVVSVGELHQLSSNTKLKTGKRLGFKFQSDPNMDA